MQAQVGIEDDRPLELQRDARARASSPRARLAPTSVLELKNRPAEFVDRDLEPDRRAHRRRWRSPRHRSGSVGSPSALNGDDRQRRRRARDELEPATARRPRPRADRAAIAPTRRRRRRRPAPRGRPCRAAVTATLATEPPKCGTNASRLEVGERLLADEVDEGLAEAERCAGRRTGLRVGARAHRERGRYPRRRVRVDEHTIEVEESPVFYRSAERRPAPVRCTCTGSRRAATIGWTFLGPDRRDSARSARLRALGQERQSRLLARRAGRVPRALSRRSSASTRSSSGRPRLGRGGRAGLGAAQPGRVRRLVLINRDPAARRASAGRAWPGCGGARWSASLCRAHHPGLLARTLRRGSVSPGAWLGGGWTRSGTQFDQGTQRAILRLHRATGERAPGCRRRAAERARRPGARSSGASGIRGSRRAWPRRMRPDCRARPLSGSPAPDTGRGRTGPSVVDRVAALLEEYAAACRRGGASLPARRRRARRCRVRDRLPAEPRPGRASAPGEAVLRRGVRAVEQLVVRRPPHAGYSVLFPPSPRR